MACSSCKSPGGGQRPGHAPSSMVGQKEKSSQEVAYSLQIGWIIDAQRRNLLVAPRYCMLRERYDVATAMSLHDGMDLPSSVRIDFFRGFFASPATYAINTSSLTKPSCQIEYGRM